MAARDRGLAPPRRFQTLNLLEYGRVVKIDADHRVMGLRNLRFYFEADDLASAYFRPTEPIGVRNFLQKNLGALFLFLEILDSVTDVVLNDVVKIGRASCRERV